jgi:hypothetical protein
MSYPIAVPRNLPPFDTSNSKINPFIASKMHPSILKSSSIELRADIALAASLFTLHENFLKLINK